MQRGRIHLCSHVNLEQLSKYSKQCVAVFPTQRHHFHGMFLFLFLFIPLTYSLSHAQTHNQTSIRAHLYIYIYTQTCTRAKSLTDARTRTNTNTIKCLYRFMKNAYSALLFLCPISEHLKLPPRLLVGEPLPIPRCRVASYRHGLWDRRSEGSWVSCPKCVTCSHVAFLTIYKSLSPQIFLTLVLPDI